MNSAYENINAAFQRIHGPVPRNTPLGKAFEDGARWAAREIIGLALYHSQPTGKIDFGALDDAIREEFGVLGVSP